MFSERLIELMNLTDDIKSEELATKIGVGGSTVRFWTEGRSSIKLSNAIKLAEFFNCSLRFLFGFSEETIDFTPHVALPFYDRLRQVMKEKKVSIYKIIKQTKISSGNFDSWKNGADPFIDTVIELADYLKVTIDYLVGRER